MTAGARPGATAEVEGAFDVRLALSCSGLLRRFNQAGILSPADVHVAQRLGDLASTGEEAVLLACALAVRAPRLGHVCVDLATVGATASADLDVPLDMGSLPWPELGEWVERLEASPLAGPDRPLRLEGSTLYLDRYWAEECQVAADLLHRADMVADGVDIELLADGLSRLFDGEEAPDLQRLAAASAVLRHLSVIAGGPGTGKTTTVARVLALLDDQAMASPGASGRPPLVALAAPTGKAAARLEEAVHAEAARLPLPPAARQRLLQRRGTTLHRLLGRSPVGRTRFRHDRLNRLVHDVVIVDETSMVSLSLMAALVEAVRSDARLVFVGDPEQLASVEAGAVLGDLVGPAAHGLLMRPAARRALARACGHEVPAIDPPVLPAGASRGGPASVLAPDMASPAGPAPPPVAVPPPALTAATPIGDGIVLLRKVHRYGKGIAALAQAIQTGDGDAAMASLRPAGEDGGDVRWIPVDVASNGVEEVLGPIRDEVVAAGSLVTQEARSGRAAPAISALGSFRVLCAHRRGPAGVAAWTTRIERWLSEAIDGFASEGTWYVGRPLLVTANDYSLRLYNGDTGVIVSAGTGRVAAAFERGMGLVEVSPTRLGSVETVYAMTVHKAQGSQFGTVAVVLPAPDSPILTRELLHTAVTRARTRLVIAGTEEAVRTAARRPVARSSGLARRLWGL